VGDEPPERIVRQAGTTIAGDGQFLMHILFPYQEPSTILWDRF